MLIVCDAIFYIRYFYSYFMNLFSYKTFQYLKKIVALSNNIFVDKNGFGV